MSRKSKVHTLTVVLVAALVALTTFSQTDSLARPEGKPVSLGPRTLKMNELQVIGTHNSYHRELSRTEQAEYDELVANPGDYQEFLAYKHVTLNRQLASQDVRGLELDLLPDPDGGLYREPLVRERLDLGPLPDPAWDEPGIKVFHITDLDYNTTCVKFVDCLKEVRAWSEGNPGHVPVLIMLELKQSDPRAVVQGGAVAPPWDGGQLDALDREIRSVFGEDEMITPDDVRRDSLTLEESVLRFGWPSLRSSRGQVAFLMDNEGALNDVYSAGRPNLEGRVLFTNSNPGEPDAAFIKRNEPTGENTRQIKALVRDGYLVRTRSDIPLETVKSGDTMMLEATVRSGAQLISTDFPEEGMSDRYGSDFVGRLPNGGTIRCNPVNGPEGCRTANLEE